MTVSVLSANSYADFKKNLSASKCQQCELGQKRTHIVVDRGNPESKVLIIGEAPGENEDLKGQAFVGRAGRLLDAMLEELRFYTNDDSIIVNIVKCRPPDNRRPTDEEAKACQIFLKKQFSFLNPEIILLLGATALKHIVKTKHAIPMKEVVGKFLECPIFPGAKMMVLYHPAYILRDPRKKPLMMEHLKMFKAQWDQVEA